MMIVGRVLFNVVVLSLPCLVIGARAAAPLPPPSPTPYCTTITDCSGHASAVEWSPELGRCNCTCDNQWFGNQCQLCIANYSVMPPNSCNACNTAQGYNGSFPDCQPAPTCTASDCNSNGWPVGGTPASGCICQCYNGTGWSGNTCNTCASNWNQNPMAYCASCAIGYGPVREGCPLKCTVVANCSDHAVAVSGNFATGCKCTCDPSTSWYGATCNLCPQGIDPSLNCRKCLPGYSGYPNCIPHSPRQ